MTRNALASLFSCFVFITTSITAAALAGCGLANDFAQGFQEGAAQEASTSCHQAVKTCEGFVTAACDRLDQCGIRTFDECTSDLLNGHFPCEKADDADDFTQCDADFATASCDALANAQFPQSCNAPQIFFGNTVCR